MTLVSSPDSTQASLDRRSPGQRRKLLSYLLFICTATSLPAGAATLASAPFGNTADGQPVRRYTMTAESGVSVSFMNYGGSITDITTPDRNGRRVPIVLGFPTLRDYEGGANAAMSGVYFGSIIGRYANFIAKGQFNLDGHQYRLAQNYLGNFLNGGNKGFDKKVWQVQPKSISGQRVSALLTYTSPDGEEGFPGTVKVSITYSLSDDGVFTIHYEAVTDKTTVINLTNHANFNLSGAGSGDVLQQVLTIDSDKYTPTDKTQIPLGPLAKVDGTPFDFRMPVAIGARIHYQNEQLILARGYDQNWVLNKHGDPLQPQHAVHVYDPKSGRTLDCFTTEPALVIYTGNFFDGSFAGTGGVYRQLAAFTLETQHFPDSPNQPAFPTTVLNPGQIYKSTTVLQFGVQR